ncbi:molecular chaperone DnaK [bacterium]|nr:molecular chaperone DnaK [bacterium]
MGKCIGIDLGTGFSAVSVMENGSPKTIVNSDGNSTTPSVVAFTNDGKLVGNAAKRQSATNAERTIYESKRLIGRLYKDKEVQDFAKIAPFKLKEGSKGEVLIEVDGKDISPVEISAAVLSEMKKYAEDYLGETVKDAVVTVPAFFTDAQKQATIDAGVIAGLTVHRIISEPTSACLAYGFDGTKEEKVLIVDIGSGTSDTSIIELGDGVVEVIATGGDSFLGGVDLDMRIVNWLIDEFKKEEGIDLSKDNMALNRLKDESEKAKKALSSSSETDINLPFITADTNGPKHLTKKLTRAKFESMTSDLVDRIQVLCKTVLKDSKLKKSDIDEVILVGGSTRVPAIQEMVEKFFGKKANKSVNPDEVVSNGACIQASILAGDTKDILLLDVIPLSLSLETLGGVATKIVEKNTSIPCVRSQTFSTAQNNQTAVSINVLQGEREMAADNKTLGRFDLVDIPPAQRGIPQIFVEFNIDANGILTVSAKDQGTGKEQSIKIESSSGLSDEDIERMVKDAEEHAEEDKKKRELVDTRNQAEGTIFQIEKSCTEFAEKITEEEKAEIDKCLEELKELLTSDNKDDIMAGITKLNDSFHVVTQKIYATGEQAPPQPTEEQMRQAQEQYEAQQAAQAADVNEAV